MNKNKYNTNKVKLKQKNWVVGGGYTILGKQLDGEVDQVDSTAQHLHKMINKSSKELWRRTKMNDSSGRKDGDESCTSE